MTELNTPVRIGESMDWRYIYDATGKEILKVAFDYKGSLKALEELIRRANAYDELVAGILNAKSILIEHHNASVCPPIAGVVCQACCNGIEEKPHVKEFFDLVTKLTNEER